MKPSLPQGTRDFGPETVRKRTHILNTIRAIFELYGYQPLETPAMEQLDTLMGKYGEEGDKLIFKILNNGLNDPKNIDKARTAFDKVLLGRNDKDLTERALRYDLTIPFARYVAMNHRSAQPSRSDATRSNPSGGPTGRRKAATADSTNATQAIVGGYFLINGLELASIYRTAFRHLGIPIEIKVNNRKILAALAEVCGGAGKMTDITVAIDKLDKIGLDKVKTELTERGLDDRQVQAIEQYLAIAGSNGFNPAAVAVSPATKRV